MSYTILHSHYKEKPILALEVKMNPCSNVKRFRL